VGAVGAVAPGNGARSSEAGCPDESAEPIRLTHPPGSTRPVHDPRGPEDASGADFALPLVQGFSPAVGHRFINDESGSEALMRVSKTPSDRRSKEPPKGVWTGSSVLRFGSHACPWPDGVRHHEPGPSGPEKTTRR
jgi:hypothetical protein